MRNTVLVTGGAGYIGSHAVKRLLDDGRSVVVVDNLVRGHPEAIDALRSLRGVDDTRLVFERANLGESATIARLLRQHDIADVMHFGALAYVGESVSEPLRYYHANTADTIGLLRACADAGVERFVFSSTCATYGEPSPDHIPIAESTPQHPINPYGRSKLFVERIIEDFAHAQHNRDHHFAFAHLRYFNVAGADPSGVVGEAHDPETHLIPIVLQVALGHRDAVTIFGTDYPTPDGTCIRDYVHVADLIDAHVAVLERLRPGDTHVFNVGIGRGYSVREIIDACARVTDRDIPTCEGDRRAGDPPILFNDPSHIRNALGWSARYSNLDDIIETAWRWHRDHPNGYADAHA